MTKDEALKMAIEALQNISESLTEKQVWFSSDVYEAINACKEALEQPEGKKFFERGKEIARWADKQAQEPVAWMMVHREPEHGAAYLTFDKPSRDQKISHHPYELYTHPHQWQALRRKNNGNME